MSQNLAWKAATIYTQAGMSVIPIRTDGSKALALKAGERKVYEERHANADEINQWFGGRNPLAVGILGGKISGNLCCIDFDIDAESIFPKWCELIPQELLDIVVVNRTPRPGYHVIYRVDGLTPPTAKLATKPVIDIERQIAVQETVIETRGQGGYFVAPGSPNTTHKSKEAWKHVRGRRLSQIGMVSVQDHEAMIAAARSFNYVEPPKARRDDGRLSPGTDFNRRADWATILEPHGWKTLFVRGDETYWQRPGKNAGVSATTGHCKTDDGQSLFHVFTSNAHPFDVGKTYDKFGAYTLLNHTGDFSDAAKALFSQGYGEQRAKPTISTPKRDPLKEVADAIRKHGANINVASADLALDELETVGAIVMMGIDYIREKKLPDFSIIAKNRP